MTSSLAFAISENSSSDGLCCEISARTRGVSESRKTESGRVWERSDQNGRSESRSHGNVLRIQELS